MGIVTINIPSQLPALTGNSLLYLRVNVAENGIEWAATAGGGITIGTTAIASGTVNRILFEGAGNVVQQDSTFVWNNTDKRLILGTEVVASTNSRLVVIGKGTGTGQTFAVHNSTGINNTIVALDNGNVGIGINNSVNALHVDRGGTLTPALRVSDGNLNGYIVFGTGTSNTAVIGLGSSSGAPRNQIGIRTNSTADTNYIGFTLDENIGATTNGYRMYPRITFDGQSNRIVHSVLATSSATTRARGFDFAVDDFVGIVNPALFQQEDFRFYTRQGKNTNGSLTKRFVIKTTPAYDDTTTIPMHEFVNSRLGITDGATNTADNSALLKLESTTRGFLPPRMTTAQRDLIATPATGLLIYNTTDNKHQGYDGSTWNNFY